MFGTGKTSVKAQKLMDVTYDAMMQGIKCSAAGRDFGRYRPRHPILCRATAPRRGARFLRPWPGAHFPRYTEYSAYGRAGEGLVLREGMFFTIEPMLNLGKPAVKILGDGWTAVTRDRTLSAQYEHSVGITGDRMRNFHQIVEWQRHAAQKSIRLRRIHALAGKTTKTPPAKQLSKPTNPREGHRQRLRERLQRAVA
jgi:hypothetical protein